MQKALAAACTLGVITTTIPNPTALADSEFITGSFGAFVIQYNSWRDSSNGISITFDGQVNNPYLGGEIPGSTMYGLPPGRRWAIGIRDKTGQQFSRLEFNSTYAKGTFPGTRHETEFALNTKGFGYHSTQKSDFSGNIDLRGVSAS